MWKRILVMSLFCLALPPQMNAWAEGAAALYHGGVIYVKAGAPPAQAAVVQTARFALLGRCPHA